MNLKTKISSIINHEGFKKYFFNTGWLMLDKILRMFLGLFVGVWVARYLGPEDFGILSFSLSFVGLFVAFGKLGLNSIVVRELVKHPEEKNTIIGTSIFLRILGGIVLLIVVFLALQLTSTNHSEKIIVMIIALGQLFLCFEVFDFYFQSQVKGKFSGIAGTVGLIASSAARITFMLAGLPLIWFAVAVVIEHCVRAANLLYFYLKQGFGIRKLKVSWEIAKDLLRNSWSLILSGIAISIYMKIDQVMIKEMLDSNSVGQYAAAVRLTNVWYFLPTTIVASLFPAMISSLNKNKELFYYRLQKLYDVFFIIAFLICLAMSLFSEKLVLLLFGSDYIVASQILTVYIWSSIFVFHGAIRGQYLIAMNKQVIGLQFRIVGMVLNLILNYLLIGYYGVIGAAYATLVSFLLPVYLLAFKYKILREDLKLSWKAYLMFWIFRSRNGY